MEYIWIIMIAGFVLYLAIYSICDWIRVCRYFNPGHRFENLDDRTVAFCIGLIFTTFFVSFFLYIQGHSA